jgi:hypothetical protein
VHLTGFALQRPNNHPAIANNTDSTAYICEPSTHHRILVL